MDSKPYLIFSLHGLPYAIAIDRVREIFLLPELIPVAEAPVDIIGLLDLRSQIVPMMHLDLRFGHQFDRCNLSDCAIVVNSGELSVGIIVHQVRGVNYLNSQAIAKDLSGGRERKINQAFLTGAVEIDAEIVFVLDVDNLVRHPDAVEALVEEADEFKPVGNFYDLYFPQATTSERAIMRQRAESLKALKQEAAVTELLPLAVVNINGEYFGLDLDLVSEFAKISSITTIPRAPAHIIGNMNLRGEILTLVDLRRAINLPSDRQRATKAVAVNVDDIFAGIVVDEVLDVMFCYPEDVNSLPLVDANNAKYFKGTTTYSGKAIGIIDVAKVLTEGVRE